MSSCFSDCICEIRCIRYEQNSEHYQHSQRRRQRLSALRFLRKRRFPYLRALCPQSKTGDGVRAATDTDHSNIRPSAEPANRLPVLISAHTPPPTRAEATGGTGVSFAASTVRCTYHTARRNSPNTDRFRFLERKESTEQIAVPLHTTITTSQHYNIAHRISTNARCNLKPTPQCGKAGEIRVQLIWTPAKLTVNAMRVVYEAI